LKGQAEIADELLRSITPLAAAQGALLLEVARRAGSWHEVTEGSPQQFMKVAASDTKSGQLGAKPPGAVRPMRTLAPSVTRTFSVGFLGFCTPAEATEGLM
jgi:hypothetical protein